MGLNGLFKVPWIKTATLELDPKKDSQNIEHLFLELINIGA